MNFYEAWHWLNDHPLFTIDGIGGAGGGSLYVEVVRVNPDNETIEDDEWLNTATRVWLEGGPWEPEHSPVPGEIYPAGWSHDYNLDCGAPTYEEAVVKFVGLVKKYYGDYGSYSSLRYGKHENALDILFDIMEEDNNGKSDS